jgi:hypothetical protein
LFCSDDCRSWSLMRTVQLMKKMSDTSKNIFRVYHIRIISHDMKQTDSSIIIVRNVCVLTSASMIVKSWVTRITVRENRIICCQIFCDLLLKSAFERIFNIMQLILVKIKWHITCKWKYLIQKFHDICLSYYFKVLTTRLILIGQLHNEINITWDKIILNSRVPSH